MKGARFILPGCTGFRTSNPDLGEFKVIGHHHYRVICTLIGSQDETPIYIPMRDFTVLDYPKDEKTDKK